MFLKRNKIKIKFLCVLLKKLSKVFVTALVGGHSWLLIIKNVNAFHENRKKNDLPF